MNGVSSLPFQFCSPHPSTYSIWKRLFDIIGSLIGLIILAIVYPAIAIAIKLDTPGPIIFTQKRYGLHGKPFRLHKFRTMILNAETLKTQIPNQAQSNPKTMFRL
ncbi:MAG: sugar transferase [Oscillatoria sp. PMC 1068.18]|nr:sugar transferase [Oscillatoria sp. PMC 1076.18]MEC4990065.1 sugar transferase [Oscillatoria sp. PMC 1068.18]